MHPLIMVLVSIEECLFVNLRLFFTIYGAIYGNLDRKKTFFGNKKNVFGKKKFGVRLDL